VWFLGKAVVVAEGGNGRFQTSSHCSHYANTTKITSFSLRINCVWFLGKAVVVAEGGNGRFKPTHTMKTPRNNQFFLV
jgi:succinate dehydrogenase/fumarate reductase flavoprotein subunit